MKLLICTAFLACFLLVSGEKIRYDNYRIYTANIDNEKQLEVLQALESYRDGILFLESPMMVKRSADLLVAPHKFADVTNLFESFEINNEIKVENVQRYENLVLNIEIDFQLKNGFQFRQFDR